MKRDKNYRKNKLMISGIIASILLIVLINISPGAMADSPDLPTRGNPGMAYDSQSDKIVIFGGWNMSTTPSHQDTWIYDFNSDTYTKKTPSPAPRRRAEMGMVYDSLRDKIVLFGGMENWTVSGERNDTWTYDYNSDTWTQLFPVSAPSERRAHSMAYDSESDRIILFGGMEEFPYPVAIFFNETWAYDPGSNTWQKMSPVQSPLARVNHDMVYDSESDRIILFGGCPGLGFDSLDETWAYDYNSDTWENLTSNTHPSKRSEHKMAYDSESDRVVLFGGGTVFSTYGDTWLYNYNNNTWDQMSPTTSPSARCRHAAAYDSESDRVIIYGGTTGPWDSGSTLIDDIQGKTWAYDVNTNSWERKNIIPPDPPTLTITTSSPTTSYNISLQWTASSGADNYTLYRHTSEITSGNLNSATEIKTITGTSTTDTVPGLGSWYYAIIANNVAGSSGPSNSPFIKVQEEGIPGYSIFFLIGTLSIVVVIISKKIKKS
ncbi:MAG: Loki-CTERM sorting domain-containing protein [Candidatus Hodarchaeota archaeon]